MIITPFIGSLVLFWMIDSSGIIVLVAINQPFTLWMLRSFFETIPKDLDESAMVDGCSRFEAFFFQRQIVSGLTAGAVKG